MGNLPMVSCAFDVGRLVSDTSRAHARMRTLKNGFVTMESWLILKSMSLSNGVTRGKSCVWECGLKDKLLVVPWWYSYRYYYVKYVVHKSKLKWEQEKIWNLAKRFLGLFLYRRKQSSYVPVLLVRYTFFESIKTSNRWVRTPVQLEL